MQGEQYRYVYFYIKRRTLRLYVYKYYIIFSMATMNPPWRMSDI